MRTVRDGLREAAEALCNRDLQERVWLLGQWNHTDAGKPSFDDAVNQVIDELEAPNPDELIGYVLHDETELRAFLRLQNSLNDLVTAIGRHGTFADVKRQGRLWRACIDAARELVLAMAE